MKLWRGISAHALNKNGASIGGATPPQMSTNPSYLILQAEWGEPAALMGKPLSQSHISSCLYELLGLKVKRQPTICGPPSFITLQHRELVQVGVGQFMKSSLPDTWHLSWSVLAGDNTGQTKGADIPLGVNWKHKPRNRITCTWITFICIVGLGHGGGVIQE